MDIIMILKAIITLTIIFFISGYITFNAFKVDKINNLKLSLFETIFLQILSSIIITGLVAFTLAMLGYFSLLALCGLLLLYNVIIVIKFKVKFSLSSFPKPTLDKQSLFLIVLIILSGSLFLHPIEDITGRRDAGVYINTGVNIAETQSIIIQDNDISKLPKQFQSMLEFPAFFLVDENQGIIIPGHFHLFQTWLAIMYSIVGLKTSLYIQAIFSTISVIVIFLIGKMLFNTIVGTIASTLLSVNLISIFFAQYPSPEILFQLLIFTGILFFFLYRKTSNAYFGIFSALCFGELFITRIDCFLFLIALAMFYLFSTDYKKRLELDKLFLITFLIMLSYSILYYKFIANVYISDQIIHILTIPLLNQLVYNIPYFIIALILIIFFICIFNIKDDIGKKYISKLKYLIAFFIGLIVIFFYITAPEDTIGFRGTNLISLGWFFTDLLVVLGIIGLFIMFIKNSNSSINMFLYTAMVYSFYYINYISNAPVYPWAMRRYITVVIPALILGIGYFVNYLYTRPFYHNLVHRNLILPIFILFITIYPISMSATLLEPQFIGYIDSVREISNFFDNNSVVIDSNKCSDVSLGLPIRYIFKKNAFYLQDDQFNPDLSAEFTENIRLFHNEGKDIYIISSFDRRLDVLKRNLNNIEFKLVGCYEITISKKEWEYHSFKNTRSTKIYKIEIYKLIPK